MLGFLCTSLTSLTVGCCVRAPADNAPAFSVDNVDAVGGTIYKVIRDGELLNPIFNATMPGITFDYNTNVTYFRAELANDTYVPAYTVSPTVVTALNPYYPAAGTCQHVVTGQMSDANGNLNMVPQNMSVNYT